MKKLKDFRQQKQNPNRHTERGMAVLEKSMETVGYTAPMVAAADGELIIGSARHEKAAEVFGSDVETIVVESDGKRPIVVVRKDIPNAKHKRAKQIAAIDNRSSELNLDWDVSVIADTAKLLNGGLGFDEAFLKSIGAVVIPPSAFDIVDENLAVDHVCPKCGYQFSGGKTVAPTK